MTKKEEREERERQERDECFKRQNKITIDGAALADLMGDLMPNLPVIKRVVKKSNKPLTRLELQTAALAELAEEGGWKKREDASNVSGRPIYIIQ